MQKPPVDDFISILETFLVEWKPGDGSEQRPFKTILETFLVEWKLKKDDTDRRLEETLKPS